MPFEVLILNSGEWLLTEELPSTPWHVLIYRQRSDRRNELHLWLPGPRVGPSGRYAFRRFWMDGPVRWCVELPPDRGDPASVRARSGARARVRFTSPDGVVRWSPHAGSEGLADFTDSDLLRLRRESREGPFSSI